jgi:hypothetical protein
LNPELHCTVFYEIHLGQRVQMAKSTARIALISGGNKGIGCEVARQLGKAGVTDLLGEAVGGTRFSRSTALEGQ